MTDKQFEIAFKEMGAFCFKDLVALKEDPGSPKFLEAEKRAKEKLGSKIIDFLMTNEQSLVVPVIKREVLLNALYVAHEIVFSVRLYALKQVEIKL